MAERQFAGYAQSTGVRHVGCAAGRESTDLCASRLSTHPLHALSDAQNNDGSYLLLLDPSPKVASSTSRQAAALNKPERVRLPAVCPFNPFIFRLPLKSGWTGGAFSVRRLRILNLWCLKFSS
jgi:hypothetical protein